MKNNNILLSSNTPLTFGKYKGLTPRQIIKKNEGDYLRWCYYHLENVSLDSNLLSILKIDKIMQIAKPGTAKMPFRLLQANKVFSLETASKRESRVRATNIIMRNDASTKYNRSSQYYRKMNSAFIQGAIDIKEASANSKGALAWKNQGH